MPSKTKAIEEFFIGEPPKKRRVIELATKLAKSVAETMKTNKLPKQPKPQKALPQPLDKVKNVNLKQVRKSKKVQMKNIEP